MNSQKQIQLIPEGKFNIEDLDLFLFELERRFQAKEVMTRKEVAKYIGVSERTVDRLSNEGVLPFHRLEGLNVKLYLREEIKAAIKNAKP
jgi:excisionase family DNA binding protein